MFSWLELINVGLTATSIITQSQRCTSLVSRQLFVIINMPTHKLFASRLETTKVRHQAFSHELLSCEEKHFQFSATFVAEIKLDSVDCLLRPITLITFAAVMFEGKCVIKSGD
jgi:hypothetical protein